MKIRLIVNRHQLAALKTEADGQFLADLAAAKLTHDSKINFVVWTDESNLPGGYPAGWDVERVA